MTTTTLKKNISKALENIEDEKFLKAVYDIISSQSKSPVQYKLTDEQKLILEDREREYLQGKGKSYTWEETKKMIRDKKK